MHINIYRKIKTKLFNAVIKLTLITLPKIDRRNLIKIGNKKNTICVVEKEYEFRIKEPIQALAKKRFNKTCGLKKIDCFFGIKFKNVRLIGPYGIPFTNNGRIIIEPISKSWLFHTLKITIIHLGFIGFLRQYLLAIFPIFDSKLNFLKSGGYLLCRGAKSSSKNRELPDPVFGHWLGEQLPQIRAIEGVYQKFGMKCPLIINKKPKDWQIESLELMGYGEKNLYEFNQKGLRVGEIIIPSLRNLHSKETEFDPKARKWAAERLQLNFAHINLNKYHNKNICLFRQNENTRRISNYDFVKKSIKKNNYNEVTIDNLTLFESSKNFYLAENFLSIYGSGILRIMFMKRPKKLIEIFSTKKNDREIFFLLANEFNMNYECIPAETVNNNYDNKHDHTFEESEWLVPITELEKCLIS